MNDICGIVPVMVNTYSLDQGVMMPLLDNVFNVKTDVYSEAMMLRKSSNGQPQYFKLFYTHPHPDVPCNTTIYNIWSADFCGELLVFLLDKTHSAFVDIDKLGDVDHDIGSIVAEYVNTDALIVQYLIPFSFQFSSKWSTGMLLWANSLPSWRSGTYDSSLFCKLCCEPVNVSLC